jgi:hypothetical protein
VVVLTPPDDLDDDMLRSVLASSWGRSVSSMTYRPVGWGSHHWDTMLAGGVRVFVTLDELDVKRQTRDESLDVPFFRLNAALTAARALAASNVFSGDRAARDFVAAPLPGVEGTPLARVGERYAVAVYPFVSGES